MTRDSLASRRREANGEHGGCEGNAMRRLAGLFLPVVVVRHAIIVRHSSETKTNGNLLTVKSEATKQIQ